MTTTRPTPSRLRRYRWQEVAVLGLLQVLYLLSFAAIHWQAGHRSVESPQTAVNRHSVPDAEGAAAQMATRFRRIASQTLRLGMDIAQVHDALETRDVALMCSDSSALRAILLYGTGSLADPVLFVTFRLDQGHEYHVVEWRVEE